jgi:hypothetical protein
MLPFKINGDHKLTVLRNDNKSMIKKIIALENLILNEGFIGSLLLLQKNHHEFSKYNHRRSNRLNRGIAR